MIRLGVLGYGRRINAVINETFRQVEPDLRVVGIVDPDEAGARSRLAECDQADVVFYDSLKSMLHSGKIDALAVGTRCNLHAPYAIEAAETDLPLFLEKPVAVSMEQAAGLEKAFRSSKCPVVVSFPLRVSPICVMARQLMADGAIGRPEHILGINYVPYGVGYFTGAYRVFEVTQGLFLQKATHDLDYMSYLMDSPIVRVAAMASWGRVFGNRKPAGLRCSACDETETCHESPYNRKRYGSAQPPNDLQCPFGVDVGTPEEGMNEDASSALIEFANGAQGVYTQVFFSRRDAAARGATISGYEGTITFDWYKNEMRRIRHHQPFSDTIKAGEGMSHFGGDMELAYDFINLINGRGQSRTTIWDGIRSAYACLCARESAKTGQFVAVPQV